MRQCSAKVEWGHVKWIVSAMRSCYHIIPEKNDVCCFGCVTSSLLHGVVIWLHSISLILHATETIFDEHLSSSILISVNSAVPSLALFIKHPVPSLQIWLDSLDYCKCNFSLSAILSPSVSNKPLQQIQNCPAHRPKFSHPHHSHLGMVATCSCLSVCLRYRYQTCELAKCISYTVKKWLIKYGGRRRQKSKITIMTI